MDNREHFNETYSRTYDGSGDLRFHYYTREVLQWLRTELPTLTPRVIVDLGAGDFWHVSEIGRLAGGKPLIMAFDISDSARILCQKRIATLDDDLRHRCSFVQADICRIPLRDGSVDLLISTGVMEHLDDELFLAEVHRVLSDRGIALIATVVKKPWAWYYLKDAQGRSVLEISHLREYASLGELQTLFQRHGFHFMRLQMAPFRYSLLTPLLQVCVRLVPSPWVYHFPSTAFGRILRLVTRIRIPGYYSAEILASRSSGLLPPT